MENKKAILTVTVKHPKSGKEIVLKTIVPSKAVQDAPKEHIENFLKAELQFLALEPQFSITVFHNVYSMVDLYDQFQFGDTLIEVNIPYCLHLPRGFETFVTIDDEVKARVEFQKVWTKNATGSSESDFYGEDVLSYFQKQTITTPTMPHNPSSGWDIVCNVKNAEKLMDRNGVYRYTILRIFIETKTSDIPSEDGSFKALERMIQERCQQVVNRILDTYKYVSREIHVERLPTLTITNVYFQNINAGYYPMPLNVGSAMMNRSENEIEKINTMLTDGMNIANYERLFLSAQNSLNKKDGLLAIVESYQAFEIFLESNLFERYKKQGLTDEDIETRLHNVWKTKDRLKDLLKEVTGKSLAEIGGTAWEKWCRLYKKCRNEVIHAAKEIGIEEASEALTINEYVASLVQAQP